MGNPVRDTAKIVLVQTVDDTGTAVGGGVGGGDATAANQATGNASLSSIDTKLTSVVTNTAAATPAGTNTIGAVVLKDGAGTEIVFTDPSTGTVSTVASSATAVTLKAANTARKGITFWNNSTQSLFLSLSATDPTTAVASVKILADGYYEAPYGYTGIVKGIWTSANGNVIVTELT